MLDRIVRRSIREISKLVSSPKIGYPVLLDYPVTPLVRHGWGKPVHAQIDELLRGSAHNYRVVLEKGKTLAPWLDKIAAAPVGTAPHWANIWFTGLDAMALYTMLVQYNPRRLVEIGSGNSTKFARRAINDHELQTRIVSIDPQPRAEIDALCDETIRMPLETSVSAILRGVSAGDMLFFDGSHRAFQNSDVTVFFLEILPNLAPGVLVHIHDIFLPCDYPEKWAGRLYSEQYMLAAWLLGGARNIEILFPSAFVGMSDPLKVLVDTLAGQGYRSGLQHNIHATGGAKGVSFWFVRTS